MKKLMDKDSYIDGEGNGEAVNWDGSAPRISGDTVFIEELHCDPTCGCGGCRTVLSEYEIGPNNRFHWEG